MISEMEGATYLILAPSSEIDTHVVASSQFFPDSNMKVEQRLRMVGYICKIVGLHTEVQERNSSETRDVWLTPSDTQIHMPIFCPE